MVMEDTAIIIKPAAPQMERRAGWRGKDQFFSRSSDDDYISRLPVRRRLSSPWVSPARRMVNLSETFVFRLYTWKYSIRLIWMVFK